MTADILHPDFVTVADIPAANVINHLPPAEEWEDIIVIGEMKDGTPYLAFNKSDGGRLLWMLEMAKKRLLEES